MKRIIILFIIFCLTISLTLAQEENKKKTEVPEGMYFLGKAVPAPDKIITGYDSIVARDAEAYVRFLSSDLLEGRETATPAFDIAAEFAAALFQGWGIQPAGDYPVPSFRRAIYASKKQDAEKEKQRTYFQTVITKRITAIKNAIDLDLRGSGTEKARTFQKDIDYLDNSFRSGGFQKITAPVVFIGFGIREKSLNFDEFKGIDVKGKVVLMFSGTPQGDKKDSPFRKGELKDKYYPPITARRSGWTNPKIKILEENGAAAVLEVSGSTGEESIAKTSLDLKQPYDEEPMPIGDRQTLTLEDDSSIRSSETIPRYWISKAMGEQILGLKMRTDGGDNLANLAKQIGDSLKPQSRSLEGVYITITNDYQTEIALSRNVIGFIEGSDPELKKEVVVIGAHLDHVGKMGEYIYNGANDNASGSAAVLELAQAFALNPVKPKRSILFALWTGEEHGMLGSLYYTDHPYYPMDKTVAYLNMDMIGWEWEDKDSISARFKSRGQEISEEIMSKIDLSNFLMPGVTESSTEVYETLKDCGRYMGGVLFLRKAGGLTGGSDYVPFARKKVPWVHFVTGGTKYTHHPGDSIDKISFDMIQKVTRYIYTTGFALADK